MTVTEKILETVEIRAGSAGSCITVGNSESIFYPERISASRLRQYIQRCRTYFNCFWAANVAGAKDIL